MNILSPIPISLLVYMLILQFISFFVSYLNRLKNDKSIFDQDKSILTLTIVFIFVSTAMGLHDLSTRIFFLIYFLQIPIIFELLTFLNKKNLLTFIIPTGCIIIFIFNFIYSDWEYSNLSIIFSPIFFLLLNS